MRLFGRRSRSSPDDPQLTALRGPPSGVELVEEHNLDAESIADTVVTNAGDVDAASSVVSLNLTPKIVKKGGKEDIEIQKMGKSLTIFEPRCSCTPEGENSGFMTRAWRKRGKFSQRAKRSQE